MNSKITFSAVGDIFINRRLPEGGYEGFDALRALIGGADVRFANLETTIHDREGYPFPFSGGTWAMASPAVLEDLKRFRFNLFNAANNHAMDYSHNGLEATMRHLERSGVLFAGIGKNLADASAPVYLECAGGRVALIAATTTFQETWIAGQQRPDMQGRPGVNGIRRKDTFYVTDEQMAVLRAISEATFIDAQYMLAAKDGFFVQKPGTFRFGGKTFATADTTHCESVPDERDLNRLVASIKEARSQADCVLVSIHSHDLGGLRKDYPSEFYQALCHACIDAGANAILGHGPHVLRGIELYHGGVIFYSLGNFLFENDTTTHQPADFYEKYGLPCDALVGAGMDARSRNGKIGLGLDADVWRSVVAKWSMENGSFSEITLYPITLHQELSRFNRGLPSPAGDSAVLHSLAGLCAEFGTKLDIRNGIGIIEM